MPTATTRVTRNGDAFQMQFNERRQLAPAIRQAMDLAMEATAAELLEGGPRDFGLGPLVHFVTRSYALGVLPGTRFPARAGDRNLISWRSPSVVIHRNNGRREGVLVLWYNERDNLFVGVLGTLRLAELIMSTTYKHQARASDLNDRFGQQLLVADHDVSAPGMSIHGTVWSASDVDAHISQYPATHPASSPQFVDSHGGLDQAGAERIMNELLARARLTGRREGLAIPADFDLSRREVAA